MLRIVIIFFSIICNIYSQNAWINEFHYDNEGVSDQGEFVEVAIENEEIYLLDEFRISFYSSVSGSRYGIYHSLDTFTKGVTENNITLYFKLISGIQNGANDGIALDYDGTVLQFLSYEGTLTASEGVASGITSIDVGVEETSSTPIGYSVGLIGNGTNYSSFAWTIFSDDSRGQPNTNQALPVELTYFSVSTLNNIAKINWETATEVNNYGFEIERTILKQSMPAGRPVQKDSWEKIGFVDGHGNSNSPKYYSYSDKDAQVSGKYIYRLKQIDIDGKFEYSNTVELEVDIPTKFEVAQNYPNPFNPVTSINISIPTKGNVQIVIYSTLGEKVTTLVNSVHESGNYRYNFDASNLRSGTYLYKVNYGSNTSVKKMILLK